VSDYDFLIVGAGTAGCVLAARLSEAAGCRVALVEAGGPASAEPRIADPAAWPLLQESAVDWGYRTPPQSGTAERSHACPRGKVVGGSSAINAMAHVRGHPSDFDAWAEAGCAGWSYRDLLPYFEKSEGEALALLQPDPPHPLTVAYCEALKAQGRPAIRSHNDGPRMDGPTLNSLTVRGGKRQSTADAYLTEAVLARPNLTLLRAEAVRLLVSGSHCYGIQTRDGQSYSAARTILSAGAIATPRLLLLSGIGPAAELEALGMTVALDLPGVGRNLHDHLLSAGNLYRAKLPVPPSAYQHSESLCYGHRSGEAPDAAPGLVLAMVTVPVTTEAFDPLPMGEGYTLMFGFTHPRSRGRVALTAADPDAPLTVDPAYLSAAEDREAYLEALDWARATGASPALDDWRAEEILPGAACHDRAAKQHFLERAAYTHHHPAGTCAMGQGTESVTDPGSLALHGCDGLHVVDASILPRLTTGPCNAAVVAMAERASDLLLGRRPLQPA